MNTTEKKPAKRKLKTRNLGVTLTTVNRLLRLERRYLATCLTLYCFLAGQTLLQKTLRPHACVDSLHRRLDFGKPAIRKALQILQEMKLIEVLPQQYYAHGQYGRRRIKVNYLKSDFSDSEEQSTGSGVSASGESTNNQYPTGKSTSTPEATAKKNANAVLGLSGGAEPAKQSFGSLASMEKGTPPPPPPPPQESDGGEKDPVRAGNGTPPQGTPPREKRDATDSRRSYTPPSASERRALPDQAAWAIPNREAVRSYVKEIEGNEEVAEQWYDSMEQKGWCTGKVSKREPVRCWRKVLSGFLDKFECDRTSGGEFRNPW